MLRTIMISIFTVVFTVAETTGALAAEPMSVFVSILPQKTFVQKIGMDRVDVQVMVEPGASPATYEPKPRQMAALAEAKAYFAIGVPFEKAWLQKIAAANPQMRVVHTDHGIAKIPMATHHHHEGAAHRQGPTDAATAKQEGHHRDPAVHGGHFHPGKPDPHVWLSPPLVIGQARAILDALQAVDPAHADDYALNYKRFVAEVVDLDLEIKSMLAGRQGLQFMVFHPAWGYFAHAYNLVQVPVEIEGKDPKPARLQELIAHAKERDIKVVFVQPQFSTSSAELVAREIGGRVAFADPLAADWSGNLRQVAGKFKAALR
jgi:zinc transport system substrate-binding protein